MSSQELVPTTYDRNAWNIFQGAETTAHDDHLTAEQAQRINESFTVRLVTGVHAFSAEQAGDDPFNRPYEKTYEAAKQAVDMLEPGDVLLREGYGHAGARVFKKELTPSAAIPSELTPMLAAIEGIGRSILGERASQLRKKGAVDTWEYAEMIARSKGIEVVNADMDRYDAAAFNAAVAVDAIAVITGREEAERAEEIKSMLYKRREEKAVNIAKDWMLAHLDEPLPEGKKRTVMVLFGEAHRQDLEDQFANLGILVDSTVLDGGLKGHIKNAVIASSPPLFGSLREKMGNSRQNFTATHMNTRTKAWRGQRKPNQ